MTALLLVALVTGREAGAQHTFGIDVIVTEHARGTTPVYRYRVVNAGSAPCDAVTLGWDRNEGDAFLETEPVANGTHVLTARARDAAGNTTVSAPVSVTVANDLTPPTISLTSPLAGAVLSGTVTLTVSVQAVHQVMVVMYLIDNVHLGGTATAPYSQSWNTTTLANGSHEVRALAMDKSGRYGKATINVTVSN